MQLWVCTHIVSCVLSPGIGSGGPYALAAARALMPTDLSAREIAERAMTIAADICVYTNKTWTIETFKTTPKPAVTASATSDSKDFSRPLPDPVRDSLSSPEPPASSTPSS